MEVVFKNSSLRSFPNQIFDIFTDLKILDISRSELQELEILQRVELEWLDASQNNIQNLSINSFANTPSLIYLYLSRNRISTLNSHLFDSLTDLQVLDLSHNNLKDVVDNSLFTKLSALKFLLLNNNNKLNEFRANLAHSEDLIKLDLSNNQIKQWTFFLSSSGKVNLDFSNAIKMKHEIDGNHVTTLKLIAPMSSVRANYNHYKYIEINPNIKIISLELKGNDLIDISNITRVPSIQHLDLSENPLMELKKNTFENMTELRYLGLRKTLVTLKTNFFSPLHKLNFLDISENKISSLDFKLFRNMFNLKNLQLEKNLISKIENYEDTKEILPKLETIAFAGNPLECQYLMFLITYFQIIDVHMEIGENLTEVVETNLRGFSCKDMSKVPKEIQLQDQYQRSINVNVICDNSNKSHEQTLKSVQEMMQSVISSSSEMNQDNMITILHALQKLFTEMHLNSSNVTKMLQDNLNKINERSNQNDKFLQWIKYTLFDGEIKDQQTLRKMRTLLLCCAVLFVSSVIVLIIVVAKNWSCKKPFNVQWDIPNKIINK